MTAVMHVMRTYGVHGGERQLGQLFSAFCHPDFQHLFCFVYRDEVCAHYFSQIANLKWVALLGIRARQFPSLVVELALLLVCLPLLQFRLWRALKNHDCRVCVAHGLQAAMICWLPAYMLRGVRFVYVHRGTKSALGSITLFKLLYAPFAVVAGVSEASSASLKPLVAPHKLMVLENGIDLEAIDRKLEGCTAKSGTPFVISAVGRLMPGKGQRLLLQAFTLFQRAYPASELWLAGDGPDRAMLEEMVGDLPVRFLGHHGNVAQLLTQSDIFSHASESEGLSNAVLEAMAVGIASVVVDAPGVSECHVEGKTGFIVIRTPEALCEKWLLLAHDAALRQRMGDAARTHVQAHYSIAENCRRYESLYLRLLA